MIINIILPFVLALFLSGATSWLAAAPTVGTTAAAPALIPAATPTTVMITTLITDPSPIATSVNLTRLGAPDAQPTVLGVMHDDGKNGDLVAGDNVYTVLATFNEPAINEIKLQSSAAFRGLLRRILGPVISVGVGVRLTTISNISITVPTGWTSTDINTDTFATAVGFMPPNAPHPEYGGDLTLFAWNNPLNLSSTQFFDGSHGAQDLFSDTAGPIESIIINGHLATHFSQVTGIITKDIYVVAKPGVFIECEISGNTNTAIRILDTITF